jgi:RNA polymerase sigma-32 factor
MRNRKRQPAEGRPRNPEHDDYIRQVGRVAPLDPAEEAALTAEYARTRDPEVARRLAAANLRLVIKMASQYHRRSSNSLDDLVQEGTLGLMEAVVRFDPGRGVRFASYAGWWIRAFLLKYLLDNARLVRAGRTRADRRDFFHGRAPAREVSIDVELRSGEPDGDGQRLLDVLPDLDSTPPDQAVEQAQLLSFVRGRACSFTAHLSARDAAVFEDRVLADASASLTHLATRFRVSRQRMQQIEKRLTEEFRAFALAS